MNHDVKDQLNNRWVLLQKHLQSIMNFLGLNLSYLSVDVSKTPEIPDYKLNYDYYNEEDIFANDVIPIKIKSLIMF